MAAAIVTVKPNRGDIDTRKGKDISLYTGHTYRLYVKMPGKRFAPVDASRGVLVGNLIYATMFQPRTLEDLEKMVEALGYIRGDNPGAAAEYREVK